MKAKRDVKKSLRQSILEIGPAPCDDGCPLADQCYRFSLACPDYYRWIQGAKACSGDRIPMREIYLRIFGDAERAEYEPAIVELKGTRRMVGQLLSITRTTAKQAADMAGAGISIRRFFSARCAAE